jgi:exonuclease VII large subunit
MVQEGNNEEVRARQPSAAAQAQVTEEESLRERFDQLRERLDRLERRVDALEAQLLEAQQE